jgi:hypothetical protein
MSTNEISIETIRSILRREQIPEYFRKYMENIMEVCRHKTDGGFEESMKYFLAAKLYERADDCRKQGREYEILAGTTPIEDEIKVTLGRATKPDLLILESGQPKLFVELKTSVTATYRNSFLLAYSGSESSHADGRGDFHNLVARKQAFPAAKCFLLLFFLDDAKTPLKEPKNWAWEFFVDQTGRRVSAAENHLMHEYGTTQMWYRLIEVLA